MSDKEYARFIEESLLSLTEDSTQSAITELHERAVKIAAAKFESDIRSKVESGAITPVKVDELMPEFQKYLRPFQLMNDRITANREFDANKIANIKTEDNLIDAESIAFQTELEKLFSFFTERAKELSTTRRL